MQEIEIKMKLNAHLSAKFIWLFSSVYFNKICQVYTGVL